jgi:hypothetical protein
VTELPINRFAQLQSLEPLREVPRLAARRFAMFKHAALYLDLVDLKEIRAKTGSFSKGLSSY